MAGGHRFEKPERPFVAACLGGKKAFVVEIMHTIYLALGTNLGDRMENLRRAIAALSPTVRVTALSSGYGTHLGATPTSPPSSTWHLPAKPTEHLLR